MRNMQIQGIITVSHKVKQTLVCAQVIVDIRQTYIKYEIVIITQILSLKSQDSDICISDFYAIKLCAILLTC